jgi:hypothetical protein
VIQEVEVERATALLFGGRRVPVMGSGAWRRELKAAFHRRVLETHPDRARVLGKTEAELRREFVAVAEAYRLLGSLSEPARPSSPAAGSPPRPAGPDRRRADPPPPPPRGPREHFHRGSMPQGRLRFAEFLYYSGRISWQTLVESIAWQRQQRPPIGRIAVGWGHLTEEDVREVLESRRREGAHEVPFGEHALRRGMLTPFQLLALLGQQRRMQRRIGEFFVQRGIIGVDEVAAVRLAVMRHNARCRSPSGDRGSA